MVHLYPGVANAWTLTVKVDGLPMSEDTPAAITIGGDSALVTSETVVRFLYTSVSTSRTVTLWSNLDDGKTHTLQLKLQGGIEYAQQEVNVTVQLEHFLLLTQRNWPEYVAVGDENSRSFVVSPPNNVTLTCQVYASCADLVITPTDISWLNSAAPISIRLSGVSRNSNGCLVNFETKGGVSRRLFKAIALQGLVTVYARPSIVVDPLGDVAVSRVRGEGLNISIGLTGNGVWRFASEQRYTTTNLNSSLVVTTTETEAKQPKGVAAMCRTVSGFVSISTSASRSILFLLLGPNADFASTARDSVTIRVLPAAIENGVTMDESSFSFVLKAEPRAAVSAMENTVISSAASSAIAAGGSLSLGAATQAGKLQSIMQSFVCPDPEWRDEQDDMPWNAQPIRMSFASKEDLGTYAAVGLTNTIVIALVAIVHLFAAYIVYLIRETKSFREKSFSAATAIVRFPSYLLFPALFLYQPVVSSSLKCILYSPNVVIRMIGAGSFLVFGLGLPAFVYMRVNSGFTAFFAEEPQEEYEKLKKWARLFHERGEWKHSNPWWISRYGMFFDEYRQGVQWFLFSDVMLVFFLGCLDAVEPNTPSECNAKVLATTVLFGAQLLMVLLLRPFLVPFQNYFFSLAYVLQFTAMVLICIAIFRQNTAAGYLTISVQFLFIFSAMLVLKSLWDIARVVINHMQLNVLFREKKDVGHFRALSTEEEEVEVSRITDQLVENLVSRSAAHYRVDNEERDLRAQWTELERLRSKEEGPPRVKKQLSGNFLALDEKRGGTGPAALPRSLTAVVQQRGIERMREEMDSARRIQALQTSEPLPPMPSDASKKAADDPWVWV